MNPDDLPEEIVQPLPQLGRALMAHARAHRDTSLAEHEDGVLGAWRVLKLSPWMRHKLQLDVCRENALDPNYSGPSISADNRSPQERAAARAQFDDYMEFVKENGPTVTEHPKAATGGHVKDGH